MSNLMAAQYVSNLFCSAVMVFHVDTDFLSVKVIVQRNQTVAQY